MGVGEGNTKKRDGEQNFVRETAVTLAPPITSIRSEKGTVLSNKGIHFLSFINLLFIFHLSFPNSHLCSITGS